MCACLVENSKELPFNQWLALKNFFSSRFGSDIPFHEKL